MPVQRALILLGKKPTWNSILCCNEYKPTWNLTLCSNEYKPTWNSTLCSNECKPTWNTTLCSYDYKPTRNSTHCPNEYRPLPGRKRPLGPLHYGLFINDCSWATGRNRGSQWINTDIAFQSQLLIFIVWTWWELIKYNILVPALASIKNVIFVLMQLHYNLMEKTAKREIKLICWHIIACLHNTQVRCVNPELYNKRVSKILFSCGLT